MRPAHFATAAGDFFSNRHGPGTAKTGRVTALFAIPASRLWQQQDGTGVSRAGGWAFGVIAAAEQIKNAIILQHGATPVQDDLACAGAVSDGDGQLAVVRVDGGGVIGGRGVVTRLVLLTETL